MQRRVVVLRAALDRSTPRTRAEVARILDLRERRVTRLERRAVSRLRGGCDRAAAPGGVVGSAGAPAIASIPWTMDAGAPQGGLLAAADTAASAGAVDEGARSDRSPASGDGGGDTTLESLDGEVDIPGTESTARTVTVPAAVSDPATPFGLMAGLLVALALTGVLVLAVGVRRGRHPLVLAPGMALRHPLAVGLLKATGVVLAGLVIGATLGLLVGAILN